MPDYNGGGSGGGFTNPMTTLGDMITGGAGGTAQRLAAGGATQVLTITGGVPGWAASASGFANPMTTVGDLIVGGAAGAATRLAAGAANLGLVANGAGVAPTYQAIANSFNGRTGAITLTAADLAGTGDVENVNTVAASGAAQTIPDVTTATMNFITLTANCTFTFPAIAAGKSFTMELKQDATGGRTAVWPAAVKWVGKLAPTLSTLAAAIDLLSFTCLDGVNWLGNYALNFG